MPPVWDLGPPPDERVVALGQPGRLGHHPERDRLQPRQDLAAEPLRIRLIAMRGVLLPDLALPLGHRLPAPLIRHLRLLWIFPSRPGRAATAVAARGSTRACVRIQAPQPEEWRGTRHVALPRRTT